jgi:hypothetical protein
MILTILLLIGAVCVLGALLVGERSQRLEAEGREGELGVRLANEVGLHQKTESMRRSLDIENSKLVARNSHLAGKLAKLQEALNEDQ